LGFGVWGGGAGPHPPNPQTPIPNPQSPIPNILKNLFFLNKFIIFY